MQQAYRGQADRNSPLDLSGITLTSVLRAVLRPRGILGYLVDEVNHLPLFGQFLCVLQTAVIVHACVAFLVDAQRSEALAP
jgi:hypothetical protein